MMATIAPRQHLTAGTKGINMISECVSLKPPVKPYPRLRSLKSNGVVLFMADPLGGIVVYTMSPHYLLGEIVNVDSTDHEEFNDEVRLRNRG
jgi:hypothetical protein